MEKYIKADTALKFINGCLEHEDKITDTEKAVLTGVKTCIERIPAADVVEVKHGRWIDKTWTTEDDWSCYNHHIVICSVCNKQFDYVINEKSKYCSNCGARMDEV